MSDMNPKNYDGANLVVVGRASGPMEIKEFNNGGRQAQLSIAVNTGYMNKKTDEWVDTGTNWYTLTAKPEFAEANWPVVAKGDKVRVDDTRLEFKPYLKKDGTPNVEATLTWGTLVVVTAKADHSVSASTGDNPPW